MDSIVNFGIRYFYLSYCNMFAPVNSIEIVCKRQKYITYSMLCKDPTRISAIWYCIREKIHTYHAHTLTNPNSGKNVENCRNWFFPMQKKWKNKHYHNFIVTCLSECVIFYGWLIVVLQQCCNNTYMHKTANLLIPYDIDIFYPFGECFVFKFLSMYMCDISIEFNFFYRSHICCYVSLDFDASESSIKLV